MATRDKLRARLSQIEKTREEEARSLEKFSELRMEGTLDYNVRLAELQQNAAKLAARTLGKKKKICAFITFPAIILLKGHWMYTFMY